jgi:hypothetical protein
MSHPRVYADFQDLDGSNCLRLTCAGTSEDLSRQGIALHEGLVLTLYMDDAIDDGEPDDLLAEGVVHSNAEERCWVAAIDWSALYHASDECRPEVDGDYQSAVPAPGAIDGGGISGSKTVRS